MTNTQSFAKRELDILVKTVPDTVVRNFVPEILALCEKFGLNGESGGSAPYTAGAICATLKKLLLQDPICPITGIDDEWYAVGESLTGGITTYQNNRCGALFNEGEGPYYLDAIVWKGDTEGESGNDWDTFTGTVDGIQSRQHIKGFPFTPKTFYIDVHRELYNPETDKESDAVSCSSGDYVYHIKNHEQLKEVFEYYHSAAKD